MRRWAAARRTVTRTAKMALTILTKVLLGRKDSTREGSVGMMDDKKVTAFSVGIRPVATPGGSAN
jgi:hypothetical protein